MSQRTWPNRSTNHRYAALPIPNSTGGRSRRSDHHSSNRRRSEHNESSNLPTRSRKTSNSRRESILAAEHFSEFSTLPDDILTKIAANFRYPELQAASLVCRSWSLALKPLRESILFLQWGKRYKHGRGGVCADLRKALDMFLKGAERGSTLAMVDAGLIYWEMGRREEGVALYRKAALLGDPAGQCNLAISNLKAEPPNATEAVYWLRQSAQAGYVRAQYQLALCLHQGQGVGRNLSEAARWYLKAAEAGYVRAMYNVSLCYSLGEGMSRNHRLARKWMKQAADRGHSKALYEHGLIRFSEGEMMNAVLYLELATRAGETAATHVRDVILQQLSASSRDQINSLANNWRALPSPV